MAIRAYWLSRRKQHGAGDCGHDAAVMIAASYYSIVVGRPSRYWLRRFGKI